MPGTFVFRPLEANLTHNTDLLTKMNPYCSFILGNERIKGQICKKGGKHPHWNDSITVPATNEGLLVMELLDHDRITKDDSIGACTIDLSEVQSRGQVSKWYPLTHKNKPAGEILLEVVFQGDAYGQTGLTSGYQGDTYVAQQETIKTSAPIIQEQVVVEQTAFAQERGSQFIEQRQVVEPHTFTKTVDVVETRAVLKEIEVLEPVKVLKDVQYTEAVPVHKQIEVCEPQVVMKEVEVIEPRLVTKTIQVVENVPVMKQVEVIEPRTIIKEVETFEPQTFTKQIEVTEQVPVMKQVTVTEPVTVTKAVDFIEPVITTKTVTKEVMQPVIVDEKITTTVGPATVVGFEQEVTQRLGAVQITEEQRIFEQRRLEEQRLLQGNQTTGYSTTSTTYQTTGQQGDLKEIKSILASSTQAETSFKLRNR